MSVSLSSDDVSAILDDNTSFYRVRWALELSPAAWHLWTRQRKIRGNQRMSSLQSRTLRFPQLPVRSPGEEWLRETPPENLNLSVRGIGWIKKINLIQCIQLPSCIQSPLHLPLCHHRSPPNHHGLFCLNRPLPFIRMICQPWIPWWSLEVPATHAICVSFSARASTLTTACLPAIQVNPWPTKQHQPDPLLRFTC